jgi:hypothetical protein
MTRIAAVRSIDDLRLEVDVDASLVRGDVGQEIVREIEAQFIFLLVAWTPKVLPHDQISQQLLGPRGIGIPPSDPKDYIRKLKLSADRCVERVTGEGKLIQSVRGLGYRLHGLWRIDEAGRNKDATESLRVELSELVDACILAMARSPLVDMGDGVLSLEGGSNDEVLDLFREWRHRSAVGALLSSTELDDIESYFRFARQGRVAEEVWRELFVRELRMKASQLLGNGPRPTATQ